MDPDLSEINDREDAERISGIILRSLGEDEPMFNPFQGRIFIYSDGIIKFMGKELTPQDAPRYLADHVWENREKINKQIKKWKKMGPNFVNCGC